MTWTNDEDDVLFPLCCHQIEVRVYEGQAWAGTPMAEQSRLDVIELEVAFKEDIIFQEDHG